MDYKNIYKNLIKSRKQLNRSKESQSVLEEHHIKPKSLGGSDSSENTVLLTPREHFIAHLLLVRMYDGKKKAKMSYALQKMALSNNYQERNISSRQYERVKQEVRKNCSGKNNPLYNKDPFTEKQKKEISERMKGSKNPMFGKTPHNKGKTSSRKGKSWEEIFGEQKAKKIKNKMPDSYSEERNKKISKSLSGKSKSKEHKEKISKSLKGRSLSEETKEKMSKSRKGQEQDKVKCPHCGKTGGKPAMKRWHFDNCSQK